MIGDTLDGDISGAKNLNIKNILINRKKNLNHESSIKPDFEVSSLSKIIRIID